MKLVQREPFKAFATVIDLVCKIIELFLLLYLNNLDNIMFKYFKPIVFVFTCVRISIRGLVRRSVGWLVGPSVGPSVMRFFFPRS